ncbi:MAG: hypothetical protein E6Q54_13005 [Mycolicibacter arupensis]|uniref:Transposase n=1 Tax=Mycolicibacter arupensis TaxID=342002 RepID=A0A5C7Y0H1_9MYCO|nr:MAG: hypothetical protein E6Q54_13005 [Mycolicibacter arupensis]
MPPRRRSFTPEYRAKAAHMVIDGHRRVAEVARELDLHKDLLYTWVRDERWRMAKVRSTDTQWTDPTAGQPLSVQERAELVRLRATVAQQAKEIAFLEEASAHFAAAASKVSRFHGSCPVEWCKSSRRFRVRLCRFPLCRECWCGGNAFGGFVAEVAGVEQGQGGFG